MTWPSGPRGPRGPGGPGRAALTSAVALLALTLGPAPLLADEATGPRVVLRDGRVIDGSVRAITGHGEVRVRAGDREVELTTDVVRSAVLREQPGAGKAPHRILLADGTRLGGALESLADGAVTFRWGGRSLRLALADVRSVELVRGAWYRARGVPQPHLDLGGKVRVVDPAALRVDGEALRIGDEALSREALHALYLRPPNRPGAVGRGSYVRVMASDEQLLVGLVRRLDERELVLETAALGRLSLPRAQVWKLIWGEAPSRALLGLTMVADSHAHTVMLLDASGERLWAIGDLAKPHDVERLADGTLLICSYSGGRVMRVERDGTVRWEAKGLRKPIDVDLLPNGNVLVAEFGASRVVELDSTGKVVWSLRAKSPNEVEPVGADRILITESGKKRIVLHDRKTGRTVWTYAGEGADRLRWPMDADWLGEGRLLITDNNAHRVIEVDVASGKIVWQHRCANPYEADRLPNGNTLIVETGKQRVVEVTPDGRVVWEAKGLKYPVAVARH